MLFIAIAAVIAAAFVCFTLADRKQNPDKAEKAVEAMKVLIPGLGFDTENASGDGRDPLPVMNVESIDVVGCLEIPDIDVMAPVAAKGVKEKGFVNYRSGSPVRGRFRLSAGRNGVFAKISKLKPGSVLTFTDADGVRYKYSVITQFHLKKWDKADYDLMLTYKVDDDTRFVVGCKREL